MVILCRRVIRQPVCESKFSGGNCVQTLLLVSGFPQVYKFTEASLVPAKAFIQGRGRNYMWRTSPCCN